jgi:hypothetical protein
MESINIFPVKEVYFTPNRSKGNLITALATAKHTVYALTLKFVSSESKKVSPLKCILKPSGTNLPLIWQHKNEIFSPVR